VVNACSVVFTTGKDHPVPNEKEPGWAIELVWTLCTRERSLAPATIRAPDRPVRSYTQYRLHYTYEISLHGPISWWHHYDHRSVTAYQ